MRTDAFSPEQVFSLFSREKNVILLSPRIEVQNYILSIYVVCIYSDIREIESNMPYGGPSISPQKGGFRYMHDITIRAELIEIL